MLCLFDNKSQRIRKTFLRKNIVTKICQIFPVKIALNTAIDEVYACSYCNDDIILGLM
jgi:hypothetical protein